MSHAYVARIQYNSACKTLLANTKQRIETIKRLCQDMEAGSSEVIDSDIRRMIDSLHKESETLMKKVEEYSGDLNHPVYSETYNRIARDMSQANNLYLRLDAINRSVIGALAAGPQNIVAEMDFESVEDPKLRSMMKLLAKNKEHKSLSFDELKELAESKMDPSKKVSAKYLETSEEEIKEALGISDRPDLMPVQSEEEMSPLEIMDAAVQNVVDESLRQSAVKSIIKSIKEKGFIVEKKNIRKKGDMVTIVALKPGNQRAEFSIDLDGKFVYRFDGYEGKACEKDISSMEEDLEKIYGIKIKDKKTTWENPDKLTKRAEMYHKEGRA